jgi:hypothetical protein
VQFPGWSHRQSVEEDRHIWLGRRQHSDYITGDYETVKATDGLQQ